MHLYLFRRILNVAGLLVPIATKRNCSICSSPKHTIISMFMYNLGDIKPGIIFLSFYTRICFFPFSSIEIKNFSFESGFCPKFIIHSRSNFRTPKCSRHSYIFYLRLKTIQFWSNCQNERGCFGVCDFCNGMLLWS